MFNTTLNLGDMAHAIQLALAPVFLLTGIAGTLNVMTGRLARIIDRGRQLTERELEVLDYLRRGMSNKDVGVALGINLDKAERARKIGNEFVGG